MSAGSLHAADIASIHVLPEIHTSFGMTLLKRADPRWMCRLDNGKPLFWAKAADLFHVVAFFR